MSSKYQEMQRERAVKLISSKSPVFYGATAGAVYKGAPRDFVLTDGSKNLYEPVMSEVIEYFKMNKVSWWGGAKPTGHVLSSQIACLNHFFPIRGDKSTVLRILQNISSDFVDVLKIETDDFLPTFIQFEAISDKDLLNEENLSRGSNCTSVDALIYAIHRNGSKWLIPIEWKYTEYYNNENKATEGYNKDPINCSGNVRKERYTQLINNSKQLKNTDHYCYYFEPFYQLMRQTLWAEQMIAHKDEERIKADYFLHVHVIPQGNTDLLEKKYKCSGKGMEETWRDHLCDRSKYLIITPEKLMSGLDEGKYSDLIEYLKVRYWV